ncbi:SAM-dependent methyltransferase [Halalkalibaculum sp. DA384]|uniref:SAM-dependent methyltransferase n=1 Tax=Halalkalibaculum sp. DA384 TaxID=3373606 RepID=UPI00375525EA
MSSTKISVFKVKPYKYLQFSVLSVLLLGLVSLPSQAQDLDVPYVPTPQPVVDKMLEVTDVGEGDYVIDLGSGDGRIVVTAARRGAVGHGIDLDPQRIKEARANAEKNAVEDRVVFINGDIFEADISQASVITMYLLTSVNRKLRPELFEQLRPGTRVVSHSFDMGDWEPDSTLRVESSTGRNHTVYYWVMPAQVGGNWSWNVEGDSFDLSVEQQYQKIDVALESNGRELATDHAVVKGERVSFTADMGDRHYVYSGRVEDGVINGTVQIHDGENDRVLHWSASKN